MYRSEIIDDFVPAYSIRRHVSRTLVESCSRRARIIFFKQTAEIQISELIWLHILLFHPFQIFEIMKLPLKSSRRAEKRSFFRIDYRDRDC